jgi:hypothetical protein
MGLEMSIRALRGCLILAGAALLECQMHAQSLSQPQPQPGVLSSNQDRETVKQSPAGQSPELPPPPRTFQEHWHLFLDETFGVISAGGTIFNAGFSQITHSDPEYGSHGSAFAQRIGASAADIAAQNFFGDFLIASAFHEDPRYFRKGEGHSFWSRFGYAISRAAVIRTASDRNAFNWDNFLGSAMSAGFSNLYYPPASRNGGAMLIHFATDVADNGFVNLAPEFWPDFRRKVFGRFHHRSATPAIGAVSGE